MHAGVGWPGGRGRAEARMDYRSYNMQYCDLNGMEKRERRLLARMRARLGTVRPAAPIVESRAWGWGGSFQVLDTLIELILNK